MKSTERIEVEYTDPRKLVPHKLKKHPPEQVARIAAAIRDAGKFDQPIVVDENYQILKGCGRQAAAIALELDLVPVIVRSGLSEAKKRAIRIADNKVAESDWEIDELIKDLDSLIDDGYNIALTGFERHEVEALKGLEDEPIERTFNQSNVKHADNIKVEAKEVVARCKPGEIWQVGRHRIACGSCLDSELVDRLIDVPIGFVWADPPYGMKCQDKKGKVGSGSGVLGGLVREYLPVQGDDSTQTAIDSFKFFREHFPKSLQIWWGANHYGVPPSPCWIIWDKQADTTDFADAELAWVNSLSSVRIFRLKWNGMIRAGAAANEARVHPNQKPVELAEWAFSKYGKPGMAVLDPFLGSGCSLLAAESSKIESVNPIVYGIEIVPEYVEIAIGRWERLTGLVASPLNI